MWLEWLIEDRAKSIAVDSVVDGAFAEFVQMPTIDKPWFVARVYLANDSVPADYAEVVVSVGEVLKKLQTCV